MSSKTEKSRNCSKKTVTNLPTSACFLIVMFFDHDIVEYVVIVDSLWTSDQILCRGDTGWTGENTFYGRDIYRSGQFYDLSGHEFDQADNPYPSRDRGYFSPPAGTRDLRPVWWHNSPLGWADCLSRSSWKRTGVLRIYGLQMSREKRSCWLLTRSNF